jgi:DnaJ-class molecular chaperone
MSEIYCGECLKPIARIFDIIQCPSREGKKEINDGQVMKDNAIYQIIKKCPHCKGHGRIGKERL